MKKENFAYWLNGFLELTNPINITKEQVCMIREHMKLALNSKEDLETNLTDMSIFVHFLDGFLYDQESLDERLTNILQNKIAECFIKVTGIKTDLYTRTFDAFSNADQKIC